MPVEYVIHPEQQLVECTAFGIFRSTELREKQAQLRREPSFQPTFRQLTDFTSVTKFELSTDSLRDAAAQSVFAPGVPRAIVAPTDLGFGLARMFDAFSSASGHIIRVFRDRAEARSWLDSAKKPAT